jgi:hypothetical protein
MRSQSDRPRCVRHGDAGPWPYAWWVVLTLTVGALRARVTKAWLGRINVVSGIVIGLFALVAIGSAIRG